MRNVINQSYRVVFGLALVFSGCDFNSSSEIKIKREFVSTAIGSPSLTRSALISNSNSKPAPMMNTKPTLRPTPLAPVLLSNSKSVTKVFSGFASSSSSSNPQILSCANQRGDTAVGAALTGYTMSSALYPTHCGNTVTRTCLPSGQFDGSLPGYEFCSQQCRQPITNQAVNAGSVYYSYTKSTGATQAECDAAKIKSVCNAQTGTFLPAPSTVSPTCLVVGQVCAYSASAPAVSTSLSTSLMRRPTFQSGHRAGLSIASSSAHLWKPPLISNPRTPLILISPRGGSQDGINNPSGNSVGDTVVGYASQSATYPALCGAQEIVSCQANGTWTGSTPRYSTCTQKCVDPDSGSPVDANTTYKYFTRSSGTPSECNAAMASSTCSQTTGQFVPGVAAQRYAVCTTTKPSIILTNLPPAQTVATAATINYSLSASDPSYKVYCGVDSNGPALCLKSLVLSNLSPTKHQVDYYVDIGSGYEASKPDLSYSWTVSNVTPPVTAFYVSPKGSDSNNGLSLSTPFGTLERAQQAMRASSIKTVYLMDGVYMRTDKLNLDSNDSGETWLGYPGQTPILDGGNSTPIAIYVNANQISIRWLTIQNFGTMGINVVGASDVLVDSNTIKNIQSNGWNEGGITAYGNITNLEISHNLIRNVQYAGILYVNSPANKVSNLTMESNAVYDSCESFADCGALYADDRSHGPAAIVMNNNIVGNYGNAKTSSKGIYLDDELSNATVKNNIVYGTGTQALQVHGGNNNVFKNNIFDLTDVGTLGLYQFDGDANPNYGMKNNVFTCNIVYSSNTLASELWIDQIVQGDTLPSVAGNLYWGKNGTFPNSGNIADTSPTVGNPGFVNPSQANYNFVSSAPTFCNFTPIDTSQVGPLPNSK